MESKRSENDIYIFFEAIGQLEPQSVLDIGMLLKRAGSVSRKAMDREIPEGVRLDGVDFFPEAGFPVWRNVYNEILDVKAFLERVSVRQYDCAVFLGMKDLWQNGSEALLEMENLQQNGSEALLGMENLRAKLPVADALPDLVRKVPESARYVLSDQKLDVCGIKHKVIDLKVEEDAYYLYDFGE